MAIHTDSIWLAAIGFATYTLRASHGLFNALRAFVPRFPRNEKYMNHPFPGLIAATEF